MPIPRKELKHFVKQIKRGLSSYYIQPIGNEVPFINIRDVSGGLIHSETVETVKIKETAALEKSRLEPKDIILTAKGSAFKAAVASKDTKGYIISANLIAFTLNDEILPELVVAFLNSPTGQNELHARSAGIAQKALNIRSVLEIKIPVPNINQQRKIADYLSSHQEYLMFTKKEAELREKIKNKIIAQYMGEA